MAGRGGARPGAGRKPAGVKRALYASPIQIAEAKISERLPWLVDQLLILAEGVEIQKTDAKGHKRIWSEPPDRAAIEYLMDRVMGKPVQPIDIDTMVRRMALQAGLSEEEATEAVAEAERYLQEMRRGAAAR